MKRPSVLIMFGGESSEHDVSLKSAKNIVSAIDHTKFEPILCYIDREGTWWLLDGWTDIPDTARTVKLSVVPGTSAVQTLPDMKVIPVDVLFPVLHGKLGEDGSIQGMADMIHVPIVGCGVESSAVCMNKDATKRLARTIGVPVVPWSLVTPGLHDDEIKRKARSLDPNGPWFVKPSRAGSSVGVSKVVDQHDLPAAVQIAMKHDDLVLIETAIVGRELEVAVLGNAPSHEASGVGEVIPGSDFYDYADKYSTDSTSQTILSADLPNDVRGTIRQHALDTYQILGCSGLARVDFLLSDDHVPYLNEVNTLPGFTDISMYPKLWQAEGIDQTELVTKLITLALE